MEPSRIIEVVMELFNRVTQADRGCHGDTKQDHLDLQIAQNGAHQVDHSDWQIAQH